MTKLTNLGVLETTKKNVRVKTKYQLKNDNNKKQSKTKYIFLNNIYCPTGGGSWCNSTLSR